MRAEVVIGQHPLHAKEHQFVVRRKTHHPILTERAVEQERIHPAPGLHQVITGATDKHVVANAADQVVDASVRFLGHTRAPLVLLPLEDALGLEEQANLPGTTDTHPNWRRRLPGEASSLLDNAGAARRLELLAVARNQAYERDR